MRKEINPGLSQIAILAGGMATRLRPITSAIPKSMVQVGGSPFILHQFNLLKKNNIRRVLICAGYLGEQIQEFIGDGSRYDLAVKFSFDGEEPLGTGGALLKALPELEDIFFVMYGDSYLSVDFKSVMDNFLLTGKKGLITLFKNKNRFDKSNIVYKGGKVLKYDKKEFTPDMEYIDYGLSIFKKEALSVFSGENYLDLTEIYKSLIAKDEMAGYVVKERFYEIGSPEGLKETSEYITALAAKGRAENGRII